MTNAAIIADSSPLISLAIIEQLELLSQLYQRILIPPAVWDEVTIQGAGLPGSLAVSQAAWLEVQIISAPTHKSLTSRTPFSSDLSILKMAWPY